MGRGRPRSPELLEPQLCIRVLSRRPALRELMESAIMESLPDPDSTEWAFVFKETRYDGSDGRTLAFNGGEIAPLDYEALRRARVHEPLTVPFSVRHAKVLATDIAQVGDHERVNISTTLQSRFSAAAIGLVPGGWIPAGLAVMDHRRTILIDRNILTQIEGRFQGGETVGLTPDFLDLFSRYPVRLNPLLCVMEGHLRRPLSPAEMATELERVSAKLAACLPQAEIIAGPEGLAGAIGLTAESRASASGNAAFVLEIAPWLASPVGRRRRDAVWAEVAAAAARHGVRANSLVMLAALSAVVARPGASPAGAILKFKPGFGRSDAYAALADIRALEMLCAVTALFPDHPALLCTGDLGIAQFWSGIRAGNFSWTGSAARFDLSPVDDLLPGVGRDRWLTLLGKD